MKVFPFKLVKDTTKIARRKKSNQFKRINYEETRTISRDIVGEVQAKKSTERMPWHWEPTKDVTSCEKLRGAANKP